MSKEGICKMLLLFKGTRVFELSWGICIECQLFIDNKSCKISVSE